MRMSKSVRRLKAVLVKKHSDERGVSSIIELVIVMLILGILTAILLPTFLSTTGTAKDRSAQNNLSIAITDVQTAFSNNNQTMPASSALAATVNSADPGLSATTASPTNAGQVGMVVTGTVAFVAVYSASKSCFFAAVNDGTTTVKGAAPGVHYSKKIPGACNLAAVPTVWSNTLPS